MVLSIILNKFGDRSILERKRGKIILRVGFKYSINDVKCHQLMRFKLRGGVANL